MNTRHHAPKVSRVRRHRPREPQRNVHRRACALTQPRTQQAASPSRSAKKPYDHRRRRFKEMIQLRLRQSDSTTMLHSRSGRTRVPLRAEPRMPSLTQKVELQVAILGQPSPNCPACGRCPATVRAAAGSEDGRVLKTRRSRQIRQLTPFVVIAETHVTRPQQISNAIGAHRRRSGH